MLPFVLVLLVMKRCSGCKKKRDLSKFPIRSVRSVSGKPLLSSWCQGCINTWAKERYKIKKEKELREKREWQIKNLGKIIERVCKGCEETIPDHKNLTIVYCSKSCRVRAKNRRTKRPTLRDAVIEFLGGKCSKCNAEQELEVDHIIPLRHSGLNDLKNMQVLCSKCHKEKTRVEVKGFSL